LGVTIESVFRAGVGAIFSSVLSDCGHFADQIGADLLAEGALVDQRLL
jgi:hypothetical protein